MRQANLQSAFHSLEVRTMKSWLERRTIAALLCLVGLLGCGRDDAVTPGYVADGDVPAAQMVTVQGSLSVRVIERQ